MLRGNFPIHGSHLGPNLLSQLDVRQVLLASAATPGACVQCRDQLGNEHVGRGRVGHGEQGRVMDLKQLQETVRSTLWWCVL